MSAVLSLLSVPIAILGGWSTALAVSVLATWPRRGRPGPELHEPPDDCPPAVASYVTGRWRVRDRAVQATVVDLAARGHLELYQPDDDPRSTTIRLPRGPAGSSGSGGSRGSGGSGSVVQPDQLTPFEDLVLERVRAAARDGHVPVAALQARDGDDTKNWWKRFRAAVVEDARARGLSRPRTSGWLRGLFATAGVPAAYSLGDLLIPASSDNRTQGVVAVSIMLWLGLFSASGALLDGDRDTPLGRAVAARWLGRRRVLGRDPSLARELPAAVAVRGRDLAQAVALGLPTTIDDLVDVGAGRSRQIWSGYGGSWRVVQVDYPARPATSVVLAGYCLFAVACIGWGWYEMAPGGDVRSVVNGSAWGLPVAAVSVLVSGWLLVTAGRITVRAVVDAQSAQTVTGEVLALKDDSSTDDVTSYWLVVDDGTTDRTQAWELPEDLRDGCRPGDEVRIVARRLSRRVIRLEVLHRRGRPGQAERVEPGRTEPGQAGNGRDF